MAIRITSIPALAAVFAMGAAGGAMAASTADELRDNEDVKEFYLGGAGDQRKSFKNLKSFKRRKRWL